MQHVWKLSPSLRWTLLPQFSAEGWCSHPVRGPLPLARTPALPSYMHYSNHLISIALDNPSENSVAFPPTPPDSAFVPILRLLPVQAALIAAVCHGGRTLPLAQNYSHSQSFPLSTRRKINTLGRRDCNIRQGAALPSTFCATQHDSPRRVAVPSQHSPWGN